MLTIYKNVYPLLIACFSLNFYGFFLKLLRIKLNGNFNKKLSPFAKSRYALQLTAVFFHNNLIADR